MDIQDILKDFEKDLVKAKADMETAKELIVIGEEMGLDVGKRRAGVRDTEQKIARFESVINKHLKREK